jgi:ADP-ribose pyrophosphatase YjhB (NUDIX family)
MVGAGVCVYKDGKILLQKRRDNNCWAIHGGSVEMGEKVEDTAGRELFEETGLIAGSLELLGVFSGESMFYTYPNGDRVYIISIIYICREFTGELLRETGETTELKWFDLDDFPSDISPPDVEPLKAFAEFIRKGE